MKTMRFILSLVLAASLGILLPGKAAVSQQTAGELFEKALYLEEGQGDLQKAIGLYQDIVKRFPANRDVAAKALLHIGICYEKLGKTEARSAYNRLLRDYGDQLQLAKEARSRLAQLESAASAPVGNQGGLTFRKIEVADAGRSHQARLSPDGSKFLYIGYQDKEPHYNLRVMDFASGKSLTLVEGINANVATLLFEWSPDGKKVAYVAGGGELRIVNVEGGRSERLWMSPEKEAYVRPLDWSDQNQSLLISLINYTEKTVRLAVLPQEGTMPRTVVSGHPNELADIAQFSPDGKLIVGMKRKEKNTDVYIWKVDGGDETQITTHAAEDTYPLWSPDGKYIVFMSDRARTPDLWAIPMSGSLPAGEPFRLQANIGKNKVPSDLTRSGQLTLYAMSSAGTPSDLFVLPVDPKTGEAPGAFRRFANYPTQASRWSPNGSRIAYTSRKGNIQLPNAYVGAGGDSEELEIPARNYFINNIEWSRDGKSLLFPGWSNDDGLVGIFRISLDDQMIEPLHRPGERYSAEFKGAYMNLRWLPLASRYIFFKLLGDGKEEIFLMDPKDYRIERLGERAGMGGYSIPSPDGRYLIALNFQKKTIDLLSLADSESKVLMAFPAGGFPAISWAPDGKSFAYNEDRRLEIYSVLDGSSRTLAEAGPGKIFGPGSPLSGTPNTAFSPDGTKIAYVLQDAGDGPLRRAELWIVDATGGSSRKVADAPASHPLLGAIVWHPSGKTIFADGQAAESRNMYEHWVMENFLPAAPPAPKEDPTAFRVKKVWDKTVDSYFMGAPSPDGKYLTYSDEYMGLGVRDILKGENRFLLQNKSWANAEYCYNSIFSPDGSQVAYICQVKDRLTQLRIVNSDGTSTRILRDGQDLTDYLPFGWTADGKYILAHSVGSSGRDSGSSASDDAVSGIAFISALDGSIKIKKTLPFRVPWAAKLSLSPDGSYIAGTYLPAADSAAKNIFLLAVGGDAEATFIEHPADDTVIGWSPDGRQVLFTSDRTGAVGIWAVRVSEGKAQGAPELVRANLGNLRPLGLSRDGKLFYGISTGSSDVFIAPIDPASGEVQGPPVKAVSKYETFNASPDWSPDGLFLACHSTRGIPDNESPVLLIRSMRTGEVRELTPKTPGGRLAPYYLRWSPDGRTIIGTGRDENGQVGALLSIDSRTGETKVLARADAQTDGKGNIIALDWSSDGKSINFVRIGNEFRRICNLDLKTGVETEIDRFAKASGPFWLASSPDGSQLAFFAEGKLKIQSRSGTTPQDIGVAGGGTVLAWMADGKTILFGKSREGSKDVIELWSVPATGGQPRKTGLSMSRLLVPRVSPDGKHIAFMASEQPAKSEIWVLENFLSGAKK